MAKSYNRPLRVALLTYRGNPQSGGQGVYVRYLSRALAEAGHHVEVFSGQPYPELSPEVPLVEVPSLDLYRPEDPFRVPHPKEFRDLVDVVEFLMMASAAFPEPLTFSVRAARLLAKRREDFDIVHDNQSLAYGLLSIERMGLPVIATLHHPITVDRKLSFDQANSLTKRITLHRWYTFTKMQRRVVRELPRLIAPSASAARDTISAFGVERSRVAVVHNGVDAELFRPLPSVRRIPGRIVAVSSSDLPQKGLSHLIEALAKVRTEKDAHLIVVGKGGLSKSARGAVDRLGLNGAVTFEPRVDALRLVELYGQAEIAVVPSLYEGFSLPAVEAMSCEVPLVATTGGALPEVVGEDGGAGLLVPPGDASAMASDIVRLLDDPSLRAAMGQTGRRRVLERFTWQAAAAATVQEYRRLLSGC